MPQFLLGYFLIELVTFIALGWAIGFGWALLVVAGLFILGILTAMWQMRSLAERVAKRTDRPGALTGDAALSCVGAVLVALPGIVTTVAGLLLLLPPTRAMLRRMISARAQRALQNFGGSSFITVSGFGAPQSKDVPGWGQVIDHRDDEFDR
ncbi:FxsA family protein [uncultured Corynebacterium sp.]|uniref:FxsA family protein n=1 Tax=uncultured Corynebacterium sp. TaxID=159447 RepID=UPI0025F1140C|nr:FxsA family protein [uncultured Corynebacterium sp.]